MSVYTIWFTGPFDNDDLKLHFLRKELNFKIEYENISFGFNEASDGYSSVFAILASLILRMEGHSHNAYDMQGLVVIDEIENHLHVSMQKKIFPFLTTFFPKIQFIVSTHSPFVLSSMSNAIICDLEKKLVTDDLSGYSYDALVESYFDTDLYSYELKTKISRFEDLIKQDNLNDNDNAELELLESYFNNLPKYNAEELVYKLAELKINKALRGKKV